MASYLPLDEAAKRLGISHEELVEMRSRGEVRGFRDGASWKFPENEIARVADELADAGGDAGLSDLISEPEVGSAIRTGGSNVIGDDASADIEASAGQNDSDLGPGEAASPPAPELGSDATKTPAEQEAVEEDDLTLNLASESGMLDLGEEPKEGSTNPSIEDDLAAAKSDVRLDEELQLETDPLGGSASNLEVQEDDLDLAADVTESSSKSSAEDVLSELDLLASGGSGGTGDLISGDSDPSLGQEDSKSGSSLDFDDGDDDLVIAGDDDDDLVLGGAGSDISIAGDSGINLTSPSDSGLSLESEPLDLAGSSISALDLGAELEGSGSGPRSGSSGGSGSLVDFQADEDFQLSPSGVDIEVEEDSGSQVIEVEDSGTFGSGIDIGDEAIPAAGAVADDPFGAEVVDDEAVAEGGMELDDGIGIDESAQPASQPLAARPTYEIPYSTLNVVSLLGILLLMSFAGMIATDLMRNMWSYNEVSSPVSSITEALIDTVYSN